MHYTDMKKTGGDPVPVYASDKKTRNGVDDRIGARKLKPLASLQEALWHEARQSTPNHFVFSEND